MFWFKSCKHEVDMRNMETPICLKCSKEIPRILSNDTIFSLGPWRHWTNPALDKWYSKKRAKAVIAAFRRN